MQDLRDKLLNAGLVSKKQARKSKTDKRRKKKQKGRKRAAAELDEQQQRYQQKMEQQAAEARQRQEQINLQRAARERLHQIRDLIRGNALRRFLGDAQSFHFVGPDRRIRKLSTTHEIAQRIVAGSLAVVHCDDDPRRDYTLIEATAAQQLEQLDPGRILFWNKPGSDSGDLPSHGAG